MQATRRRLAWWFSTDKKSRNLISRLRRGGRSEEEPRITVGDLEIDLAARVVRRAGEDVHLTPIEFDLLRVLVRNRGRLMTHRALLSEVWGPEYGEDVQTLRTHIARLRAKVQGDGQSARVIVTDPGVGYRFSA